ncbi:MAG: ribonuclease III [Clostridia bacterium]|nr:ribonuclease III [Clostridia bacterium]
MSSPDPKMLPGATLAYVGDAVLEVLVRRRLVEGGQTQSGKMNKLALSFVKATEQSKAVDRILPHLDEEEEAVYKRGRNAHGISAPKSAGTGEYRRATGFEALFGYLWLEGKTARAEELFALAFPEGHPQSIQNAEKQEEIRPEEGE